MSILYLLHFSIPIGIIIMPFLPNNILRNIFYLPFLLYIIWLIFDGCPWTKEHNSQLSVENNFSMSLIKDYFYNDITLHQSDQIVNIIICGSIIASALKLLFACEKRTRGKSY